jgi:hypothetical protein
VRLVLGTAAVVLALAPTAQAKIVAQESIAGVKLGMTAAQVRKVLGPPRGVSYPKDEIQGSVKHYDYGLTDVILGRGEGGLVQSITTTSKAQRTSTGIGIGSTGAAVQRAFPRADCTGLLCTIGAIEPGKRVTSFFLSARRTVDRISLGIVID